MPSFLTQLRRGLTDAFFPPRCLSCGKNFIPFQRKIIAADHLLPSYLFEKEEKKCVDILFSDFFCVQCIASELIFPDSFFREIQYAPPAVSHNAVSTDDKMVNKPGCCGRVAAWGCYDGGLKQAIHLLKYKKKTCLAAPLGKLLFLVFIKAFADRPVDLVLPVPLHASRLRQRGFNQSFLLVKDFRKAWKQWRGVLPNWHVDYRVLKRTRKTKSQTGFDRKHRQENIKDAFLVKAPDKVAGRAVVLADDVYTTGATAREVARHLYSAGALSVDVIVLARA